MLHGRARSGVHTYDLLFDAFEADNARTREDFDCTIESFEDHYDINIEPKDLSLLILRFSERGMIDHAFELFEAAKKIFPKDSGIYTERASIHAKLGEPLEAAKYVAKAIEANPNDFFAYNFGSKLAAAGNEHAVAKQLALKSAELTAPPFKNDRQFKQHKIALDRVLRSSSEIGEFEDAIKYGTQLIEISPEEFFPKAHVAIANIKLGRMNEAFEAVDGVAAVGTGDRHLRGALAIQRVVASTGHRQEDFEHNLSGALKDQSIDEREYNRLKFNPHNAAESRSVEDVQALDIDYLRDQAGLHDRPTSRARV